MCRLAIMDKKGYNELKGGYGVVNYLNYLEKMNGGHGNGYLLIRDGEIIAFDKGVDLDNKIIVQACEDKDLDFDWFIYHTRITSQGNTCDEQCHPFVNKDQSFALCMNGTERNFGDVAKYIDTSDTDMIFRLWDEYDIDVDKLKGFSSRFIGFKNGKVFFTNPSGYSGLQVAKTKGVLVGSCFPQDIEHNKVETNYCWTEGEKVKIKKEVKPKHTVCPICSSAMYSKFGFVNTNTGYKEKKTCCMCGYKDNGEEKELCMECGKTMKGTYYKNIGYCSTCLPKLKKEAKEYFYREEIEAYENSYRLY